MKAVVDAAHRRIAPHIRRTECRLARPLGGWVRGELFLKLENLQRSGSFKLRGVLNKILSLPPGDTQKLLVAASTGNHGAAFAHALAVFGLEGRLFMPTTSAAVKIDTVRASGVPVELVGEDCVEAEAHAAAFARENGCVWVSPYNDPDVVHGQGTVAVEIVQQLTTIDAVVVPVGGGGLISGVGGYLKAIDPTIEVIGCQPRNSCVMYESLKAGKIVEAGSEPTISDGTAGGIEPESITFDLCRRFVDDVVLLEEAEIAASIRRLHEDEGLTVEGAAALPVAAVLQNRARFAGRRTALIVSGGRIDRGAHDRILKSDESGGGAWNTP